MFVRWSHTPQMQLFGVGNRLSIICPLYCCRPDDSLIVQSVKYQSDELHIVADILRRPYLSPYIAPQRFEPGEYGMEFFEKNFSALEKSHLPQLS